MADLGPQPGGPTSSSVTHSTTAIQEELFKVLGPEGLHPGASPPQDRSDAQCSLGQVNLAFAVPLASQGKLTNCLIKRNNAAD